MSSFEDISNVDVGDFKENIDKYMDEQYSALMYLYGDRTVDFNTIATNFENEKLRKNSNDVTQVINLYGGTDWIVNFFYMGRKKVS